MSCLFKNLVGAGLILGAMLGGAVRGDSQVTVSVGATLPWQGYMNVFSPDYGVDYSSAAYNSPDLRANFDSGTNFLTLTACTNVYNPTNSYWVNPDGSGAKLMDANFYVQNDSLAGQTITFNGTCLSNTLAAGYNSTAFIKVFAPDYSSSTSQTAALVGGQSFSLVLGSTAGYHVQYGFETDGLDANPTNLPNLGAVVIAVINGSGYPSLPAMANQTLVQGQNATFSVSPGGTPPFSYQWTHATATATNVLSNGGRISGAATNSLTISNLVSTDAGTYSVTVSNSVGSAAVSAVLTVEPLTQAQTNAPNFGTNVLIFNPTMSMATIQNQLNSIFSQQQNNQFGTNRYALLFQPGQYNLDINVGYYTQVLGLGQSPGGVTITGSVESDGVMPNNSAIVNFWRSTENLTVIPTNNTTMTWAVAQGTALRRVHVEGNLNLANLENDAWSSGGFLADSAIDSSVNSLTEQQWLSRNDTWAGWYGENYNMVFVGVTTPPSGPWPSTAYTVVTNTPLIREKPYLYLTGTNYAVWVPSLETNSQGTTWAGGPTPGVSVPISQFYVARPGVDNAGSINAALGSGLNLILTPGIYNLTNSILVTQPDTIVLGLGYPTLIPANGFPSMIVSDVNGVKVGGIIFDAGTSSSPTLLEVATATSSLSHAADPIFLYDLCCRVGGETAGTAASCMTINANNVVGDNFWLWRADHGTGVGWTQNPCNNGLIVNGNIVTMYGLFVEHHEQYQTLWNGNGGRLYFYQSECPYDAPSQSAWSESPGVDGYASYKVANTVTSHEAYGLGVYGVFISTTASCYNAIEAPAVAGVNLHDMMDTWISGEGGTQITHILNGAGNTVNSSNIKATLNYLWPGPFYNINATVGETNLVLLFPTESGHEYQAQYLNAMNGTPWASLGSPVLGNDTLQTITDSNSAASRFYRIVAN